VIRAFIAGHPVAHSRSPVIHGHWLARHGIAGSYERVAVAPADFPAFVRGLAAAGFAGGNVTIPHKEAAARLADRLTARAARIGAVNTLWFEDGALVGDNTDAAGFVAHLETALPDAAGLEGARALVLGAGGAARAVVVGLLERGLARVTVANRTPEGAAALADLGRGRVVPLAWAAIPTALAEADLLVNTTSLGMGGQPPLTLDLTALPAHAAVADIVYTPLETALLADARARGLVTVDGLGMLLHQAVPGFARWFGVVPAVTPALRALVLRDLGQDLGHAP
jgi:shikimate dehydrogenase